jgi:DNA-directed RNA polymerase specialized sigma24 family protein
MNKWRDWKRARQLPVAAGTAVEDVATSDDGLLEFWDREHHAFLVRQAVIVFDELSGEFEPRTLQICREVVVNQRPIKEVAEEFQMSENAVYIARMRVLRRVRQSLIEFLD